MAYGFEGPDGLLGSDNANLFSWSENILFLIVILHMEYMMCKIIGLSVHILLLPYLPNPRSLEEIVIEIQLDALNAGIKPELLLDLQKEFVEYERLKAIMHERGEEWDHAMEELQSRGSYGLEDMKLFRKRYIDAYAEWQVQGVRYDVEMKLLRSRRSPWRETLADLLYFRTALA